PGVPGVGEKTAAKLINTYGDLDGLFANLDALSPKLRQSLAENEAQVRRNAEVMELVRDVKLSIGVEEIARSASDPDEMRRLFDFLEFHSLGDRLSEALGEPAPKGPEVKVLEAEVAELESVDDAVAMLEGLAVDTELLAIAATWEGVA